MRINVKFHRKTRLKNFSITLLFLKMDKYKRFRLIFNFNSSESGEHDLLMIVLFMHQQQEVVNYALLLAI